MKNKKNIKLISTLLTAAVFLTACSDTANQYADPIIGTVPQGDIPSEPKLIQDRSPKNENREELMNIISLENFTGAAGETLTAETAVNITTDDTAPQNYLLEYDHAYFTYAEPIYDRERSGGDNGTFDINTPELLDKYNLYLKNKSAIYTVKAGDKLENGLICTDAVTSYVYVNDAEKAAPRLHHSEAAFSGELTLSGTIHYEENESPPSFEKGLLTFTADSANGKVPAEYRPEMLHEYSLNETGLYGEFFRLGNISALTEEQAKVIANNEFTDVQITIKNIHLFYGDYGYTPLQTAEITDIKVL